MCKILEDNGKVTLSPTMEISMNRAVTQMLVLHLLDQKERYIKEIAQMIKELSGGQLNISGLHSTIERLKDDGYVVNVGSKYADNRKRTYFQITENGRTLLRLEKEFFANYVSGVGSVLDHLPEANS